MKIMIQITALTIVAIAMWGCGRQKESALPHAQPTEAADPETRERADDLVGYWMGSGTGGVWHFKHLDGNQVSVMSSSDADMIHGTLLGGHESEPKSFSILVEEAGSTNAVGKTVRGIYQQEPIDVQGFDGKVMSMKIALSPPGDPFPSSFESKEGVTVLNVLKQY